MSCNEAELFCPEDLPVTQEDREALRRLRVFSPQEIFAGCQALAEAFPHLVEQAYRRPTFAGRRRFSLADDEG
jgi:hypothetical protein